MTFMRWALFIVTWLSLPAWGVTYLLPSDGGRIIGNHTKYQVQSGDTVASIAQDFGVGFLAVMALNKGVDPFLPEPGEEIEIPSQLILPDVPRNGIVVNLAELRLYHFHESAPLVDIFPIGIGRIGWETPEMTTEIRAKHAHPTWTPTENIRAAYLEKGIDLPEKVPAGPDNPLGEYALRLDYGRGEYLIHGTNKQFGVGLRVSSGCIRLFPADIEYLFNKAQVGMRVQVINQPIKTAREPDGKLYIEVHEPLNKSFDEIKQFTQLTLSHSESQFVTQPGADSVLVSRNLREQAGVPSLIGYAVAQ